MPVSHRPERDGSVATHHQVSYYLALEVMANAWFQFLDDQTKGVCSGQDVAVMHVEFDFKGPLVVGEADVDVELVGIGRTSLTFALEMSQHETPAVSGRTVVVNMDASREATSPLTADQRAVLEPLIRG
jgi:acyl-CoA thioesterase FadM